MNDVSLTDSWVKWGTSGGVLSHRGVARPFEIARTGFAELDRARDIVELAMRGGTPFSEAVARLRELVPIPHVLQVYALGSGITVVDDTATTQANEAVSSLKTVTNLAGPNSRVVVVAGAFDFDGDSDYDSLDAFGAFMVRMNVDQVFAVGPDARALFLSVGREGSWDGESQHCVDVASAYDEVRGFIQSGDVVLVMGTNSVDLLPLVAKIREEFA